MTGAAWMMMLGTWAVVFFFAGRFFYKVMTIPAEKQDGRMEGAAEIDDISEHD